MKKNRWIYYLLQVIALIICCSVAMVNAREIKMVTVDWPPFYGAKMEDEGVITVIVKTAFQRAGHNATVKFIPWARALKLVENRQYDILMGGYYSEERSKKYLYSAAIYNIEVGLVALKSLHVTHYSKLQELIPYTIGVSQGWVNNEEFDAADYLNKETATKPVLNVRKLLKKRVDMISISFDVFRYELLTMSGQRLNNIVFIQPPLSVSPIYLMVSLKSSQREEIINDFNQGLEAIKRDGTYHQILKKHGF